MIIENGMPAPELGAVLWRKSRASNSTGNCVQFATLDSCRGGRGLVGVRDSKHPQGPALVFAADDVADFIGRLKAGAYDHLISD